MEKFSNWRDKGTGISPFMPVDIPKSPIKRFMLDPVSILVKTPLFLFLYVVAAVAPKPAFKAILSFLFRFEDIALLVEGVRRTKAAEIEKNKPAVNQVVISNWVSPLDVFVIYVLSNVTSLLQIEVVVPTKAGSYRISAWQSVSLFFGEDISTVGTKIADLATLKGKLVILFAEGTASNNRAVLPFIPVPLTFFSTPGFSYRALVLKVYPNSLTLPIPYLSKWQYLARLLTYPDKGYIKAKVVPMDKVTPNAFRLVFADNGLSTVELGLEHKAKFLEYYQSYTVSNLTK